MSVRLATHSMAHVHLRRGDGSVASLGNLENSLTVSALCGEMSLLRVTQRAVQ